ncbi:hypothetical protein Tcan_01196, partial [Toxocara canis]
ARFSSSETNRLLIFKHQAFLKVLQADVAKFAEKRKARSKSRNSAENADTEENAHVNELKNRIHSSTCIIQENKKENKRKAVTLSALNATYKLFNLLSKECNKTDDNAKKKLP